jgi:hypothetical protein
VERHTFNLIHSPPPRPRGASLLNVRPSLSQTRHYRCRHHPGGPRWGVQHPVAPPRVLSEKRPEVRSRKVFWSTVGISGGNGARLGATKLTTTHRSCLWRFWPLSMLTLYALGP